MLQVLIEGVQIMRAEDHLVWNLVTITGKLDIEIILEGGLTFDKLGVFPRAMHHIKHEEFLGTCVPKPPNARVYKIEHVLLPYQGIEIRWAPTNY